MVFDVTVCEVRSVTYRFVGDSAEEAALAILEGGDFEQLVSTSDGLVENSLISVTDVDGHQEEFEFGTGWVRPL